MRAMTRAVVVQSSGCGLQIHDAPTSDRGYECAYRAEVALEKPWSWLSQLSDARSPADELQALDMQQLPDACGSATLPVRHRVARWGIPTGPAESARAGAPRRG